MTLCLKLDMARGALDPVPMTSREMVATSSIGTTPITLSTGKIDKPHD